jgi:amino acid adenylation domain-containing protein
MFSIAQLLHVRMRENCQLDAISYSNRSITYGELSAKALAVAGALIECGAHRETVGIVGQRTPSSYFGVLGILYSGCNYLPINPKYSQQRLVSMIRDARVQYIVGDKLSLQMLDSVLSNPDMPTIKAIILPEGTTPEGKCWIDEKALRITTPLSSPVVVSPADLAYVLYTSGSTGMPKGVQVLNSNVLAFLKSMADIYHLNVGFRASQTFDLSFDPSASDMFFTWANGGTLCVLPAEEMMLPHDYIVREEINFWNSVPVIVNFLHKMGFLLPNAFPTLTHSMFCGEQFPKYLADIWRKAAPNSTIENLYGPTESTIYISRYLYQKHEESSEFRNGIVPIGRPFLGHDFAIIDEFGHKVPQGEIGEIVYKGPQITKGYLNDPEKTKTVFVTFDWDKTAAKWYRSGDLGFYNVDGNYECIGRKDNQIKLGGRRIEIGEIEAVLRLYPETSNAVVVPVKDAAEVVIACVAFLTMQLSKEQEIQIRKDSEKYLERIFFPKRILYIKTFPMSPSGKIDRKALSETAREL